MWKVKRTRDAQADKDAKVVAEAFKTGGKTAAIVKINEFVKGQPAWVGHALLDKAMMILVPGSDREARLKRNEILRSGKVNDDLAPVGVEDPERALALKKYEEGDTVAQDKRKAKDSVPHKFQPMPGNRKNQPCNRCLEHKSHGNHHPEAIKEYEADKKRQAKDSVPHKFQPMPGNRKNQPCNRCLEHKSHSNHHPEAIKEYEDDKKRQAKDVLPIPVKTSNAVPMPTENDGVQRYAADATEDMSETELTQEINSLLSKQKGAGLTRVETARLGFLTDEEFRRKKIGKAKDDYEKSKKSMCGTCGTNKRAAGHVDCEACMRKSEAKATDHAGSEPADHLKRAMLYEVGNDRARALDAYRAAASGFRRANDTANEAKAREGIQSCQSGYDIQYTHPGAGRVKVCDSASVALRTALERTRAGEVVSVVGTTVRPGKARVRASDYAPWPEFDAVVRELSGVRKKLALAETAEEEAAVTPEYERLMKKKRDIERAGPPKKATDEVQPVGDAATLEGVQNYEFAHGKPPRGDGSWLFSSKKGGSIEFEHRGSFTAAKAAAIKWANGKGLYEVWVLT